MKPARQGIFWCGDLKLQAPFLSTSNAVNKISPLSLPAISGKFCDLWREDLEEAEPVKTEVKTEAWPYNIWWLMFGSCLVDVFGRIIKGLHQRFGLRVVNVNVSGWRRWEDQGRVGSLGRKGRSAGLLFAMLRATPCREAEMKEEPSEQPGVKELQWFLLVLLWTFGISNSQIVDIRICIWIFRYSKNDRYTFQYLWMFNLSEIQEMIFFESPVATGCFCWSPDGRMWHLWSQRPAAFWFLNMFWWQVEATRNTEIYRSTVTKSNIQNKNDKHI